MNGFVLSRRTRIEADESHAPIRRAAEILRRDMRQVLTGEGPNNVICMAKGENLPEEGYSIRVCDGEMHIEYADDLGAVYALLCLSEHFLGVQPLGWWNDQRVPRRDLIEIDEQTLTSPHYSVRLRGWFINDEVLLTGWKTEESAKAAMWARIFETILRCGGNTVIAGTDRAYDGRALNEMASDMGLYLTQHHTELLGARMFVRAYPDLTPSYSQHASQFEALWQEAIDLYGGRNVIWTIGYRGQGDSAFWMSEAGYDTDEARGAYISSVMKRQMELVRLSVPEARFCTYLYGEMMNLYRKNLLDIPAEVIKLWSDNGYGKMVSRRQNNSNPRVDSMPSADDAGVNGIYYHVGFYDLQAANHITMLQNPPQMIAAELERVLQNGGRDMWIVNVGSIKPHIFMIDLIRHMWRYGHCDVEKWYEDYARAYYGSKAAAPLLPLYAQSAVRYGPHEDDRAGDQFYHFPLRYIANALLRGSTHEALPTLHWAAQGDSLEKQIIALGRCVHPGIKSWQKYVHQCMDVRYTLTDDAQTLLDDTLILQGLLHESGCEGLYAFCQGCVHLLRGNDLQAYLWMDRALEAHRRGLHALRRAEHGRFVDLYKNECFANVRLTAQVLEGLRAFLRIRGDGQNLYDWEKRYLIPEEETRVCLQTHRTAQLDDDTLCRALWQCVQLEDGLQ